MGPVSVQRSTLADMRASPAFEDLLQEHAAETSVPGLPPPPVKAEAWRRLEAVDALYLLAATDGGHLVGFFAIMAAALPDHGRMVAVSESFYVSKPYRGTGAGLKLLRAGEDMAREIGCPALLVTVPNDSDLFGVLPRVGYSETSRAFLKRVHRDERPSGVTIADVTTTRLQ